jgi:hypothetical protein
MRVEFVAGQKWTGSVQTLWGKACEDWVSEVQSLDVKFIVRGKNHVSNELETGEWRREGEVRRESEDEAKERR